MAKLLYPRNLINFAFKTKPTAVPRFGAATTRNMQMILEYEVVNVALQILEKRLDHAL